MRRSPRQIPTSRFEAHRWSAEEAGPLRELRDSLFLLALAASCLVAPLGVALMAVKVLAAR